MILNTLYAKSHIFLFNFVPISYNCKSISYNQPHAIRSQIHYSNCKTQSQSLIASMMCVNAISCLQHPQSRSKIGPGMIIGDVPEYPKKPETYSNFVPAGGNYRGGSLTRRRTPLKRGRRIWLQFKALAREY